MSVDTNLYLPPEVSIELFCDVLARLLGADYHRSESEPRFVHVNHDLKVDTPIEFSPDFRHIDGRVGDHMVWGSWHKGAPASLKGWNTFMTGYREERRPVFEALVEFFAGALDMNDSDDIDIDTIKWTEDRDYRVDVEDGEAYFRLMDALANIEEVEVVWNHN